MTEMIISEETDIITQAECAFVMRSSVQSLLQYDNSKQK